MRVLAAGLFVAGLLAAASWGDAQPPEGGNPKKGGKGGPGGPGGGRTATVEEMVARLMTFDKNGDGKLMKEELTDTRLHALFDRADANKDGAVTREELTALLTKEAVALSSGGPGGPGGFGSPPPIGQLMPAFVQDQLQLTDVQKKQFDALQKEVDAKLDRLLTTEQKQALRELKERGPGRGPGGAGGPPPPPQ